MESTTREKVKNTSKKIFFTMQMTNIEIVLKSALGDVAGCCHTLLPPKGHVQTAKELYYQFPACCSLTGKVVC